ncbi:MAG: 4-(cytidine 5'-diphospho)-2-C-methyl-D-erythritol kinase [Rhabdochlamydiaceae bacterium]|nr:4-(cytidine 5'-diphospho)-2-C-methyl-D-erythritol kinase [Candidatus Amphrikana amoebophyrae]
MEQFTFKSPAKVNFFFRVLKKRSDGFHEIASLIGAINLFDILKFTKSDHSKIICAHTPLDESNLIFKAIRLFEQKSQINANVIVEVNKNIPIGGGLGGGSSNAATTLFALNQIFKTNFSNNQLIDIASLLGSDVPFFFSLGSSFCTGRGEILKPLFNFELPPFWIANPKIFSSTPLVFQSCKINEVSSQNPNKIIENILDGEYNFTNDLQPAALRVNPQLNDYKSNLDELKFDSLFMTGSGSTFVGINPKNNESKVEKMGLFKAQLISRNEHTWW